MPPDVPLVRVTWGWMELLSGIVTGGGQEDLRSLCLLTDTRTGQRHRSQNSRRVLLKEKGKYRHHKRKSGGLWPDGTETPNFVQRAICRL
jgi:hypothetical protein